MKILEEVGWADYELLDSGGEERLERFGRYVLRRPDPQTIWEKREGEELWRGANATFSGEGWKTGGQVPEKWQLQYESLKFWAKLSPFKHTGVFPEQAQQWRWIGERLKAERREKRVLNLFGYTGIATLAAAGAGASVTHVDASRPSIAWARENQTISGLNGKPIRWIVDDATKFVKREVKRGNRYEGIIMDPPIFGHGAKGEVWKFQERFPELLNLCWQLLSDTPLFLIINAYAISASALMLENLLKDGTRERGGVIEAGELTIKEKKTERLLSTGIFGRWRFEG